MSQEKIDIKILCQQVCEEFNSLGFKKDVDPRTLKESYNISKQQDGTWFKNTKLSLQDPLKTSPLDLQLMPKLRQLTNQIDEIDLEFKKLGGRIFITEDLVYKIKKGTIYPILTSFNPEEKTNKNGDVNQKLCDEISAQGLGPDRFRTEITYILSRSTNGEWTSSSSDENLSVKKIIFNLNHMPLFKLLINKIYKSDSVFQKNGGSIFITPSRVYRIKNKIEIDFKFNRY